MKYMLLIIGFLFSFEVNAALLKLEGSGKSFKGVELASRGVATVKSSVPVSRLGYGVRTRGVGENERDGFVAQLFGSDPGAYVRTEDAALSSLEKMKAVAIQITTLLPNKSDLVVMAYSDVLARNGVKKTAAIQKYLDVLNSAGDLGANQTVFLAGERMADGTEMIAYQDRNGKITKIEGTKGFIRSIFTIWLGKADIDSGAKRFRAALIKGSP